MERSRTVAHRTWSSIRTIAGALVLVAISALPVFAQFDRGTISGTVKDAQGGVIPGATVTVTNAQTQRVTSTTTDATGFYTFPGLLPGVYSVLAELPGFKKISRPSVPVDATGAIALDFALQPGAISEEVTVTAVATPLQTRRKAHV